MEHTDTSEYSRGIKRQALVSDCTLREGAEMHCAQSCAVHHDSYTNCRLSVTIQPQRIWEGSRLEGLKEFCMPNIPPYIPINTAWFLDHRIWNLPARSPVISMRLIQKTQPRTPPKLKQWPRHNTFSRNLWVVKSRSEFHYKSCEMKA